MILVDTSVWIDHFRRANLELGELLAQERVLTHPYVIGELACGSLRRRERTLADLRALPSAPHASDEEALVLLRDRKLWGKGLGWIDVHLLASALVSRYRLWTLDKGLRAAASALDISARLPRKHS